MKIRFAENLRQLRASRGLSQADLGKAIGVNQRTVSAWEHGVAEPSFTLLAALCEFFGETFDSILS